MDQTNTNYQDHTIIELIPVASTDQASFNRDQTVKNYEALLHIVKRWATFSSALFSLNWFLGVCALTWASAILLGGLLPDLNAKDFYSVSVLLLLEALRLATATFFGNFFTRRLIYRSTLPAHIRYDDKDRHLIRAIARVLGSTLQLMVLAVCIFFPWKRLHSLPRNPNIAQGHFDSLHDSLRIFYCLVLINAAIAVVGFLFSLMFFAPWFTTTFSLCRYYDHAVWRGVEKGFLYTTDFDLLAFAFKALGDEYRRNLRAPVVYGLYSDLIDYLYAHHRGFDAARIAMDSDDPCEQVAAVNIVGLWAKRLGGCAGASLLLQSRLLTQLADALDHQDTGRAATYSFVSLAEIDTEGELLEVKNGAGEKLLEILCNCISRAVKAKKEDKALVFIKVLIQLMKSKAWNQEEVSRVNIVSDLRKVCKAGSACKKRTVAVAWKALKEMNKEEQASEEMMNVLRAHPLSKEHILEDEMQCIRELLDQQSLPDTWEPKVELRGNTWRGESVSNSSTNARVWRINLSLFWVIGVAFSLCMHFIPF